jgi:Putative auto-transporter adhesin, head GIN domain
MKKLFLAAIVAVISISSFAKVAKETSSRTVQLDAAITSLVINDGVDVVLTDATESAIIFEGEASEIEKASFGFSTGQLSISSECESESKRLVVYVPAHLLKTMEINGASKVTSQETISTPNLKVTINGACSIVVKTYGKVEVVGTDEYGFFYGKV